MKEIQVTIKTDGSTEIEGIGFTDGSCEKATRELERALGVASKKNYKPEYYVKEMVGGGINVRG